MSVIDRVKSHFETLQTITIEVEEWKDEHGNASVFYSEPLTLEEKNIIFKKSNNFQDLTVLVDLLIMKLMIFYYLVERVPVFLKKFITNRTLE